MAEKWLHKLNSYLAITNGTISYAIYFCLKHDVTLDALDIDWVIARGDCVLLLMTWLYYMKY